MHSLFIFSTLDWIIGAAVLLLFCFQLYFYIRYMAGVQRRFRHQKKHRFRWNEEKKARKAAKKAEAAAKAAQQAGLQVVPQEETTQEQTPGVSVIVCARNEGDNLKAYLHALLCQNYPTFEVIVVNDASEDNTQLVLEYYSQHFRNLHLTFVPANAQVRSSKKLALTLAAKAAKYEYLLLTDADCRPESPNWIAEMMKGFVSTQTEIVIGYGAYFVEKGYVNRLVQYDTIFNAMQYLGMAMSRHPYMGVGRNLAYRKSTFFNNRGFAGQLGQKAGDDDLFVNKVCNARNTEVVITSESITWSIPKHTFHEWKIQKYRHLSVSPSYKLSTRLRLGIEPLTRGLWYALFIAVIVLASMQLLSPIIAFTTAILYIARLVWITAMMNRASLLLGGKGMGLDVLWWDIAIPINNLAMLIKHAFHRKQPLQW